MSVELWAIISPPEQKSYIEVIPEEIDLEVFEYLTKRDQIVCAKVCRRWRRIILSERFFTQKAFLETRYPALRVINQQVWEDCVDLKAYGLSFDGLAPLNIESVQQILDEFFESSISKYKHPEKWLRHRKFKINTDSGLTLITIPKGLTYDKMIKIGNDILSQGRCGVTTTLSPCTDQISETQTAQSFLITNHVFKNTLGTPRDKCIKRLNSIGFTLPELLPLCSLVVMNAIISFTISKKRMESLKKNGVTPYFCPHKVRFFDTYIGGGPGFTPFYFGVRPQTWFDKVYLRISWFDSKTKKSRKIGAGGMKTL